MAEIQAFRGIRYNQMEVKDLSSVICPPYDIISPQLQDELYRRSEYNFVRIEYNRELPQDTPGDNRYTRSCFALRQWLKQGILVQESNPAIYLHDHHFTALGKGFVRNNLICCVRLEEWEKMIIRPHENVMPKPKSDRLSMLWACQANTSPVLSLYEDRKKIIKSLLDSQKENKPAMDFFEVNGDRHQVWSLTDIRVIKQIQIELADQPLYIADGHHRYDSALTYKREKSAQSGVADDAGYSYVMMSLVDFNDPGMVILPPHRLVRGIPKAVFNNLGLQLKAFFDLEDISMNTPDLWQRVNSLLTGMKPDMKCVRLAVFGMKEGYLTVLTLREVETISRMMPYFHGDLYKKLDVSLVDHVIMEKLLGISKDQEEKILDYSYDRLDAVKRVINQEYQLAFILNPVRPELIKAIADAGDRMPRKSTYFYPKEPAGLVLYHW